MGTFINSGSMNRTYVERSDWSNHNQSTMRMKILLAVENLVMDGVKRATTVLGNALTSQADVAFYSLAQPRAFYELNAPLITARRPASNAVLNYFGAAPLTV